MVFPKESAKSENTIKVFTLSSIPFRMLEQHRGNIEWVPERISKDRNETLQSLCDISLDKGGGWCDFATEAFLEQRGK